jgi:hypothetical protein
LLLDVYFGSLSVQIFSVRSLIFTIMYKLKPVVRVPLLIENTSRMYKLKDLQQMSFAEVPKSEKSDKVNVVTAFHLFVLIIY